LSGCITRVSTFWGERGNGRRRRDRRGRMGGVDVSDVRARGEGGRRSLRGGGAADLWNGVSAASLVAQGCERQPPGSALGCCIRRALKREGCNGVQLVCSTLSFAAGTSTCLSTACTTAMLLGCASDQGPG
jgi:hypothetical protein